MATSKEALNQMSKPTRTVVKILEENWPRIKRSCIYYEEGETCPLTKEDCKLISCPILDEEAEKEEAGGVSNGKSSL